jgi:exopolysaccharide biosynthesis polyprenyl glycosylphosphotransferase
VTTALRDVRLVAPTTQPLAHAPLRTWQEGYARALIGLDALLLCISGLVAAWLRFPEERTAEKLVGLPYQLVGVLVVVGWLVVLGFSRCYETRFLGHGTEEFKRVGNATLRVVAGIALIQFVFHLPVSRGFVGPMLLLGTTLVLLGRAAARAVLNSGRRRGAYSHRVVVVGSHNHIRQLTANLHRSPAAGYRVVGACTPGGRASRADVGTEHDPPVVGSLTMIVDAVRRLDADTVAVAASPGVDGEALRRLSYELEGTGVDLLVAPALTNITGTRVSIRPVAGLPLLHVEEPELDGVRRFLKAAFDRTLSLLALVVLSPLLVAIALAVKLTTPGPALFSQMRYGRGNAAFRIWKFRSMYIDAETHLALLTQRDHDGNGPLFKLHKDPRVTPVGAFLRRWSLDELPQLINVVLGQMSLVGPRPPLPNEVAMYAGHTSRRLLVKPGITGLWQVSGRSDLSWDETVRLDLQYVENWSLSLDVIVLARTVVTILRGRGAY